MNDELISRQAAIEACLNGWNYDMETIEHIQDNISRLPSVQQKQNLAKVGVIKFLVTVEKYPTLKRAYTYYNDSNDECVKIAHRNVLYELLDLLVDLGELTNECALEYKKYIRGEFY